MSTITHFIKWKTTPKKLRELADSLEEHPVIGIQLSKGLELIIDCYKATNKNDPKT